MPRLTILAAACVALVMLLPDGRGVAAPGGGGGGVGTGGSGDGVITAGVVYRTEGDGGGSGGGGDGCRWTLVDGDVAVDGVGTATYPRTDGGVVYHLWEQDCPGGPSWRNLRVVPAAEPRDLLPGLLRRLQQRELPKPEPIFEALDPSNGWAYVQVPLDFRVSGDSWRTVSVSASIGPVWATVTATPVRLAFDSGDPAGPSPVSCGGDSPIAPYAPATPGECSYTYLNSSSTSPVDGYHFTTVSTIDWDISWTSSTGAGGPLDGFSTSTTTPLAVAEVQGLVTCTGSRSQEGGC